MAKMKISGRLHRDKAAQQLAHEAMTVSDRLHKIFDNMPYPTVSGASTRRELRKAKRLLQEAAEVLQTTLQREMPKYEQSPEAQS